MRTPVTLTAVLVLLLVVSLHATAVEPLLRVEIREISQDQFGDVHISEYTTTDSTWTLTNVSAGALLEMLYEVPRTRIMADPELPSGDYIVTVVFPPQSSERVTELLQESVTAAFGVTATVERREIEVLLLSEREPGSSELVLSSADPDSNASWGSTGDMHWEMLDMDGLAGALEYHGGWTVLNETNLTGDYELSLQWDPEDTSTLIDAVDNLGLALRPAMREIEVLLVRPAGGRSGN